MDDRSEQMEECSMQESNEASDLKQAYCTGRTGCPRLLGRGCESEANDRRGTQAHPWLSDQVQGTQPRRK